MAIDIFAGQSLDFLSAFGSLADRLLLTGIDEVLMLNQEISLAFPPGFASANLSENFSVVVDPPMVDSSRYPYAARRMGRPDRSKAPIY